MSLISQLIKGISRDFQKLFEYFNGIAILSSFVFQAPLVYTIILTLNLKNDSEFTIQLFGSSP